MRDDIPHDSTLHQSTFTLPALDFPQIDALPLRTLDADRQAHVAIASVPLPRGQHPPAAFAGVASQAVPIAWYPAEDSTGPGQPRQVLVLGIDDGILPDQLSLVPVGEDAFVVPAPQHATGAPPAWSGPTWQIAVAEEKKTGVSMHEVNALALEHAGRRLELRMGIALAGGGYHWWEWLQAEQLWSGPVCIAIRAAGYIGITAIAEDDLFNPNQYNSGYWLHRHNWLFAEVYLQIFANGLVKVTARHINNRFFDQGRDLDGFVPVIAFRAADSAVPEIVLDGSRTDFTLGAAARAIQLDIDRSADLISPEHPGRLYGDGDMVMYQPYEGVEAFLGKGEPAEHWTLEAGERRIWKGMGRTVGFDLSFAGLPVRTRRFLPPYGWQGYAGALWPDGALPARGPLEATCDGMVARSLERPETGSKPLCSGRFFQESVTLDGEGAHGLMCHAYRTGRRDLYEAALHHAYAFADIGIDHADFTQGIVGMPRGSISLVLQRNLGMLAAYLETGDPYLLRCAESLADTAYTIDRANWPRRSYGRDSAYIRSMTRLYDITGQPGYLQRAGEACRRAAQCQRPDGSFTDQGGTYGAHGHLNEIVKPWMNSILSEVMADYLERAGSDPVVEGCLVRIADWLLAMLLEDEDGRYWPYQVAWGRNTHDPTSKWQPDKPPRTHPTGDFQLDYNARTLLLVSRRTGDPRYARAWQQTFERRCRKNARTGEAYASTYGGVKVPDNFPWHEAHLWGAHCDGARITFAPILDLLEVGRAATLELPDGCTVQLRRTEAGIEIRDCREVS